MIKGNRVKLTQWIEGHSRSGPFVVRVEVDAVVPEADPSEPAFEPRALKVLDEAARLAAVGDLEALAKIGEVYFRKSA